MESGGKLRECGSKIGYLYFNSFVLLVSLIFLNLFIAIILKGFDDMNQKNSMVLQEDDLEHFKETWAQFDTDVSLSLS